MGTKSSNPDLSVAREFVSAYLADTDPERVQALEVLASLPYPIDDHATFRSHLAATDAAKGVPHLGGHFEPTDFPMTSPRSALEKFDFRLKLKRVLPPGPIESGAGNLDDVFEGDCRTIANAAFARTLERTRDELRATAVGLQAGFRCERDVAAGRDPFRPPPP